MGSRYLHLLGTVQVQSTGDEVPRFRSQRTIALLGYLVAEQRPVARDHLAALFWPDEPLSTGKGNLRRELHNLAQILPNCWQTDRGRAHFVPSADTHADLVDLDHFVEAGQWQAAADLIRGDFLEGVYLEPSTEFEMWLLGERQRRRQQAEDVLERVINAHERQCGYREALRYARCLLQLTPWREETHQQVMRLLALTGQRSEALKQFETCQRVLREELAIEASAETQALCRRIQLHANFALHNLPAETSPFIGRKAELGLLISWLSDTRVRLITIAGTGGQGKTRLALAAAERFLDSARVQPDTPFQDGIFFVDLAPLVDPSQIVTAIATALDLFMQTGDSRSPHQQLFDYLTQKRMLLILDNFENLLTGSVDHTERVEKRRT
jgi:DNA-binding SARP family transcriptional activator